METKCHPSNICAGAAGKSIDVVLVPFCNCRCSFCFADFSTQSRQAADISKLLRKINDRDNKDFKSVLILGGEPLLHPQVEEFITGIKGKEVYLTTNGSWLNAEMAKKLIKLTAINISIHHYNEKENERIFGGQAKISFSGITEAIKRLKLHGVKIRLNCLLLKGGIDSMRKVKKYVRLAHKLGADEIKFAEVQNHPELYVDARDIFFDISSINNYPFEEGCRNFIGLDGAISLYVQQTCGLVNPLKEAPINPTGRNGETKVAWPDGTFTNGWPAKKTKKAETAEESRAFAECHPGGCHFRSLR